MGGRPLGPGDLKGLLSNTIVQSGESLTGGLEEGLVNHHPGVRGRPDGSLEVPLLFKGVPGGLAPEIGKAWGDRGRGLVASGVTGLVGGEAEVRSMRGVMG